MTIRPSPVLGCAVVLAACATEPSLYRWGVYEELIYEGYRNPGSSDPVDDAARLAEDIERTAAEGARVPPGVHAHLGYLYFEQGDTVRAAAHLERERELFPESATFVDGLLERMRAR